VNIPESAVAPTLIGITTGLAAWNEFLPPLTEIRRKDPRADREFAADVRMGELAGTVVVLGIGAISSAIVGEPYPLLVSLGMVLFLVAIYEYTLTHHAFSGGNPV